MLPHGFQVTRAGGCLRIALPRTGAVSYRHTLSIPGEVEVAETGCRYRATLLNLQQQQGYNPADLLDPGQTGPELVVRNWAPGDRFWPAHAKSARKVKELLQERKVVEAERKLWPVAVRGERVLWMRGFAAAADALVPRGAEQAVLIEELTENKAAS
jgi:tRNA(Ile)-lysidine synthetase-like protein